jgi:hypothetical protein
MTAANVFLPSLWSQQITKAFSRDLVLADLINRSAAWATCVPVDESDMLVNKGEYHIHHAQACMFDNEEST